MNKKRVLAHINDHVNYPTTKKALAEACNNMMDITEEDKKLFTEKLTDGEYKTPNDVINALGM